MYVETHSFQGYLLNHLVASYDATSVLRTKYFLYAYVTFFPTKKVSFGLSRILHLFDFNPVHPEVSVYRCICIHLSLAYSNFHSYSIYSCFNLEFLARSRLVCVFVVYLLFVVS